jgi:hypothetical protein
MQVVLLPCLVSCGRFKLGSRDERDGVLTFGQRLTTATEELAGVAEESPELGKMTESTSESSDPPHQGVELDERNSLVVSVRTGSPRFRWKSSPEFSRCESSVAVCAG